MLILQVLRILCVIATILFLCQEIYLDKKRYAETMEIGERYVYNLRSMKYGQFSWIALTFFWMITSVIYALG